MNPKQERILVLTARYGLVLRPVLDRLLYDGAENGCDRDLAELRREGLLNVTEHAVAEPTDSRVRYSYYTLTRNAAISLGVSEHLGKSSGPKALDRNLAILWFCTMRSVRSYRIDSREVNNLLSISNATASNGEDKLTANGYYCLSLSDRIRLCSIYVPRTTVPEVISELRKRAARARQIPTLDMAIKSRQFAFLVLVKSESLKEQVWEQASKVATQLKVKILVHHSPDSWKIG